MTQSFTYSYNSQSQYCMFFPADKGDDKDKHNAENWLNKAWYNYHSNDYELIEYINDVNREYVEVLVEQNFCGKAETSYVYGVDRLSADNYWGLSSYYLYDGRGSVTGLTNEKGWIYQSYRYSVTGEITFGEPHHNNEYTYNGESYNPNIESQYLRARYYNVVTATFLTEDSYLGEITNPLTLNRYNYTLSNYLNYQDPSGHINEFTDYGEVSDSLRYIWNCIWKDDAVDASIAENRAYRKEEDRLEMSFCAGGVVSAFWYGLDMVALPTLILYNNYAPDQYEIGYGDYLDWRENTENYIDNQTGDFIDTNMYYTGRCSTEMVIAATEIISGGVALGSSLNKVLNKGDDILRVGQEVVDDVIDAIDDDSKAIVDDVIDAIDDGIPSGYYQDANGRWHRPNGRFASNAEVGIASSAKTTIGSHGNSLSDPRTNYGYVLTNKDTNEILKFGETLYPETRYSKNYLEQNNAVMKVLEQGSKADIHAWQIDLNHYYNYKYGVFPPLNIDGR